MLPSAARISRKDFPSIVSGKFLCVYNKIGTLKYKKQPPTLFSVVTSSKQEKKAVIRNKLRRRLYSIVKKYQKDYFLQGVLYVSKQAYTCSYVELIDQTQQLFEKTLKNTK